MEPDKELDEEKEIHLLDYLIVLAKRKKLILGITIPVAVITFVLTLFNYSFYKAETSILPPNQENVSMANQFLREYGGLLNINRNVISKQELLVEIIKSRTFSNRIIERFKLKKLYGEKDLEKTRSAFYTNLTIVPDPTTKGSVALSPLTRISFSDQNPEKAAEIANAVVEELKFFANSIAITEASQRRLFFEEQLKHTKENLVRAEEDMKLFQEKTGLVKVEAQTTMVIEKIAGLQAQITAKEVELQVMKSYSTANNPDLQRIGETIKVLKSELGKLEVNKVNGKNLLIPTGTIPALGLEYQRKIRELKFNETLYEILVKQYEAAKIDEAKEAVLIQVIDKAIPPEKETKVRLFGRGKAAGITVSAFLFSCFLAFYMEMYSRNKEHSERMKILLRSLSVKGKA